jgi:hypothetical protein
MKYLLLVSILMFATIACGQSPTAQPSPQPSPSPAVDPTNPCKDEKEILFRKPYKIKVVTGTSSATARVADYVEFNTMEPIYTMEEFPQEAFPKNTSIYAVVTRRETRRFPLVRGKLEIALEPLLTWDNRKIEMGIARHPDLTPSEAGLSEKELARRNKRVSKPCQPYDPQRSNCVAGRGDAAVSAAVTAIAGGAGTAISFVPKNNDTTFIAATSFFQVAKDLGNLLAGTDVEISKDAIFDLVLLEHTKVCMIPKKGPENNNNNQRTPTGN